MRRNVTQRSFALTILFILGISTLFSQVNIKERVEISPKPLLQKSSTRNVALFTANPDSNQGRHQEGAILVQYPCTITVIATMEVQPGSDGSYPPTDLAMFSSSALIAWYKGYPDGTHGSSGGTTSYTATCGPTGVELSNTMGYDDVTKVTRSIGSSSATITFEGKLLRYWTFTATAILKATIDESYDLASAEMTSDTSRITQCQNTTIVHAKLRNKRGESYAGVPCQGPPPPMTIAVESIRDVELSTSDQQGKQLTLPEGDVDVLMSWNYQGETENSKATVTVTAEEKTNSVTVDLIVDKTVRWVEVQGINYVMHLAKTPVRVAVYDCSALGASPLLDGSPVDLEITEGLEYGNLLDPKTGGQGKKLTGVRSKDGFVEVEYWANGIYPPERWERIAILATSGEANSQGGFYVFPGDLIVTLANSEINFGEATGITLQARTWEGISSVPQGWQTMYQIMDADTIGYFYPPDSSTTGSPLVGRYPEARFYAKSYSSPPDSVVVVINCVAVDPNGGGGGATKIVDGGHPVKEYPIAKPLADSNNGVRPKIIDRDRPINVLPITKFLKNVKTSSKSTDGKKNKVMDEPPNLGEGYYYYGAAQLVVKKKKQNVVGCVRCAFANSPISPGEKVLLNFTSTDSIGAPGDIPSNQPLDVFLMNYSTARGYLLTEAGQRDTMALDSVLPPIYYVAPDSITGDSVGVEIRATKAGSPIDIGIVASKRPAKIPALPITKVAAVHMSENAGRLTPAIIRALENGDCSSEAGAIEKTFSILLGETKYYYATKENSVLKIRETTVPPTTLPKDALPDATFDDPVAATGSKKNPVYWEDQRPTYDGTTFTGSETLPKGMLRLVGRYWEVGKNYKTTLTVNGSDGKSAAIDIEVKKPGKLINRDVVKNLIDFKDDNDYSQAKDVFGKPCNIDDTIINCAGENGIPPQYIKGHMYTETVTNANGNHQFYPSYRYEPKLDILWQASPDKKARYFRKGLGFVVTLEPPPGSMGSGDMPRGHANVQPYDYQRDPITIAGYIGARIDQYYNRPKDSPNFLQFTTKLLGVKLSKRLSLEWRLYFDRFRQGLFHLSEADASNLALTMVRTDLSVGSLVSVFDQVAQTRIVASYGTLQITHFTATDFKLDGFTKTATDKVPESLNEYSHLMPAYAKKVAIDARKKSVLGQSPPESQWPQGYECTWKIVAGWYNPKQDENKEWISNLKYGQQVLDNWMKFLPQR